MPKVKILSLHSELRGYGWLLHNSQLVDCMDPLRTLFDSDRESVRIYSYKGGLRKLSAHWEIRSVQATFRPVLLGARGFPTTFSSFPSCHPGICLPLQRNRPTAPIAREMIWTGSEKPSLSHPSLSPRMLSERSYILDMAMFRESFFSRTPSSGAESS